MTAAMQPEPTLLLTVGTDHHPFDRPIEWLDRLLADGVHDRVRYVAQHGTAEAPKFGEAHAYLDHGRLYAELAEATIVVCHGGPATILAAREAGVLPVVVPRDPAAGEHVDDHQLRFVRHLSAEGLVVHAETEELLRETVDAALENPMYLRLPDRVDAGTAPPESVRKAGALIDELLTGRDPDATGTPAPRCREGTWPGIDVVVATRNRPDLVRATVDAVLAQDYPGDVRCLVVFDGTEPDDTLETASSRRRVEVFRNTRTPGLAGSRNTGILAADSPLVAFCDDDDTWQPHKLRRQVEALETHPEASIVTCGIRVDDGHRSVARTLPGRRVSRRDLLRSRLTELHPSTFLFPRAAVEGFGLVDEELPGSYGEDYDLLLRASVYGPVVNVSEVGVRVRWHEGSHFAKQWETMAQALTALLERHPDFREVRSGYARIAGQIAFARAALGQRRAAVDWIATTLRANPGEPRACLAAAVACGAVGAGRIMRMLHNRGRGL